MPTVADMRAHLLAQDVVWVGGGSVANLLALWRLHGLDEIFREVWEAGVVLGGVRPARCAGTSAAPPTPSGPTCGRSRNGLGLHPDVERRRTTTPRSSAVRSTTSSVADGALPAGHATDDGVGLVYRGTELVEVVADRADAAAYRVERGPDGTVDRDPRWSRAALDRPAA